MFKKLLHPALVIPINAKWQPQALGAGSVVRVKQPIVDMSVHPLRLNGELWVEWMDSVGRCSFGWLAKNTATSTPGITKKLQYVARLSDDRLPAFDTVREMAMQSHRSFRRWLEKSGKKYPDQLRAVVRELGGRTTTEDDGPTLVTRLGRMILNEEIHSMARNKGRKVAEEELVEDEEPEEIDDEGGDTEVDEEETGDEDEDEEEEPAPRKKKSAKKSAKKGKSKKGDDEEGGGETRSAKVTIGTALLALVKGKKDLTRAAKALMADEDFTKKQLIQLRDDINAYAADLREKDDSKTASQLSAVNRQVRRLSRQA